MLSTSLAVEPQTRAVQDLGVTGCSSLEDLSQRWSDL